MRASSTRLAAALALALVSLAGCGGSSPKPSPVIESSASATPSPSGAPTMPAEAKGTTPEAATAYVSYYLAMLGYAARTGDVASLSSLALDGCGSCDGVIEQVQSIYDAGGHLQGDGYEAQNARLEAKKVEGDPVVRITLVSRMQMVYTAGSASPSITPESRVDARFRLTRRDDRWLIVEWTRI